MNESIRDILIGIFNEINISHSKEEGAINTFNYTISKVRDFSFYVYSIVVEVLFKTEEDYNNLFTEKFVKNFHSAGFYIKDEYFDNNILTLELITESCIIKNL